MDVCYALKRVGRTLLGFGVWENKYINILSEFLKLIMTRNLCHNISSFNGFYLYFYLF